MNYLRWLILFGAPLTFGLLGLFHPIHFSNEGVFPALRPFADWWINLHIIQLALLAPLAWAVFLLVDSVTGRAALISRRAMMIFLPFYAAWDTFAGIGTGVLIRYANGLPANEQAIVVRAIDHFWQNELLGNVGALGFFFGGVMWFMAMLFAALAFHRTGASRLIPVCLVLAGLSFGFTHVGPFGPLGMLFFLIAAWRVEMNAHQVTKQMATSR